MCNCLLFYFVFVFGVFVVVVVVVVYNNDYNMQRQVAENKLDDGSFRCMTFIFKTWLLSRSKAGGDFVLVQNSLLFI